MYRVIFCLLLLLGSMSAGAQSLLPEPQSVVWTGGECQASSMSVKYHSLPAADRRRLTSFLREFFPSVQRKSAQSVSLNLTIDPKVASREGYSLTVTPQAIDIKAATGAGLFYGLQTLSELRSADGRIACCEIKDTPRYRWRGLMLDISRHFFDKAYIEKQIDATGDCRLSAIPTSRARPPGGRHPTGNRGGTATEPIARRATAMPLADT